MTNGPYRRKALQDGGTFLWILAPTLIVVGLVTAASGRII